MNVTKYLFLTVIGLFLQFSFAKVPCDSQEFQSLEENTTEHCVAIGDASKCFKITYIGNDFCIVSELETEKFVKDPYFTNIQESIQQIAHRENRPVLPQRKVDYREYRPVLHQREADYRKNQSALPQRKVDYRKNRPALPQKEEVNTINSNLISYTGMGSPVLSIQRIHCDAQEFQSSEENTTEHCVPHPTEEIFTCFETTYIGNDFCIVTETEKFVKHLNIINTNKQKASFENEEQIPVEEDIEESAFVRALIEIFKHTEGSKF